MKTKYHTKSGKIKIASTSTETAFSDNIGTGIVQIILDKKLLSNREEAVFTDSIKESMGGKDLVIVNSK